MDDSFSAPATPASELASASRKRKSFMQVPWII
jgi:hypothetical protein